MDCVGPTFRTVSAQQGGERLIERTVAAKRRGQGAQDPQNTGRSAGTGRDTARILQRLVDQNNRQSGKAISARRCCRDYTAMADNPRRTDGAVGADNTGDRAAVKVGGDKAGTVE